MELQICAVYDLALQTYGQPIFVAHTGAAVRSFTDEVNRSEPGNNLANHAADFELHHLATYDDQTGQFSQQQPARLVRAIDLKKE